MKTKSTEIVFILDRSGSMGGLEGDTIGGYNAFLKKQQGEEGDARITTVLFDDRYELLHDRLDIRAVSPMDETQYFVRGSTALMDAVGKTIHKIAGVQRRSKPEYRAGKVIFVITTDGQENASREFSAAEVRRLVERQKKEYGWEFIFLGANIDAAETAGQIGISADRAQNYHADSAGTALNFRAMAKAVSDFRACDEISAEWNKEIQADFEGRQAE